MKTLARQRRADSRAKKEGATPSAFAHQIAVKKYLLDAFRRQTAGDASMVERALTAVNAEELTVGDNLLHRLRSHDNALLHTVSHAPRQRTGAPTLLCVCISSARGYDICERETELKAVADMSKTPPAKLCPKGLQLTKQARFLKNTRIHVAAGTPKRLVQLIEQEHALSLRDLVVIVIDLRENIKRETLLTAEPTRAQFWAFFSEHLAPLLVENNANAAGPRLLIAR